jgi:hypothetical protein
MKTYDINGKQQGLEYDSAAYWKQEYELLLQDYKELEKEYKEFKREASWREDTTRWGA